MSRLWNDLPTGFLLTLKPKIDSDGNGLLEATNVGAIPDELSLVLGEHLYQLRSALDACIYQATIYATDKSRPLNENQLEFPIVSDRKDWPKQATRRLSALPQGVKDGIERVQPFTADGLPPDRMVESLGRSLGILNDLARKDRHRQLHVMGSWPLEMKPEFTLPPGVSLRSLEIMSPSVIKEGTVIARYRLNGFITGMPISIVPNLMTNLGCDEPPPPCHPSDTFDKRLAEMVNAVGSVLTAFEQMF